MQAFKEKEPAVSLKDFPRDNEGTAERGSDEAVVCSDDFPDGGKQAWLVVIGVCPILPLMNYVITYNLQTMCSMFAA